jgi:hypothetical protein
MSWNVIERPAKDFAQLCKAIGYKKRKVMVRVCEEVSLSGVNWSGGTKYDYTAYDLVTGKTSTPTLDRHAPWDARNPEGTVVPVPENVVICKHGFFCGQAAMMYIHVHPKNAPALLT